MNAGPVACEMPAGRPGDSGIKSSGCVGRPGERRHYLKASSVPQQLEIHRWASWVSTRLARIPGNTYGLTKMLTTEQEALPTAVPSLQSSPIIHQSSVITFCRGSTATRSSSNNTLRAAEGRRDDPFRLRSGMRSCHPTMMLTKTTVAATMAQHRIHEGTSLLLLVRVRTLPNSDIELLR
jgi:hypothetical protein